MVRVNQMSGESNDDVMSSTVSTGEMLYGLALETKRLMGESRPKTLVIGTHPTMEEPIGSRVLMPHEFPPELRDEIVGTPAQVLQALRHHCKTFHSRYTVAMAAFELHHFSPDELREVMDYLGLLAEGSVIMTDYAVTDKPKDDVRRMAEQKINKDQLSLLGGCDGWLRTHQRFSEDGFFSEIDDGNWWATTKFRSSRMNVGVAASTELRIGDLERIRALAMNSKEFLRANMDSSLRRRS